MTNESYLARREIYQNQHKKNEANEKKTPQPCQDTNNETGSAGVVKRRQESGETDKSDIEKNNK